MKPLLGYLFLAIGISFGIASNSFAKISDGFTKVTPSILCIVFMCLFNDASDFVIKSHNLHFVIALS